MGFYICEFYVFICFVCLIEFIIRTIALRVIYSEYGYTFRLPIYKMILSAFIGLIQCLVPIFHIYVSVIYMLDIKDDYRLIETLDECEKK